MRQVAATALGLAACLSAFSMASGIAQAEAGVDSVFDNPAGDTTASVSNGTESSLDALMGAKPVNFRGAFTGGVGVVAGWKSWPGGALEGLSTVIPSGYFSFANQLSWDARLDRTFAFSATLLTTYPGTTTVLSNYLSSGSALPTNIESSQLAVYVPFSVAVEEMFFDYAVADALFLRIGKQANTWGNERLFSLTDLMSDSSVGLTIKAYAPFGKDGITGVILDQPSWHPDATYPGLHSMAYLVKLDFILGRLELQASGRYRSGEGARTVAALKTTILGIDFFDESMLTFDPLGGRSYTSVSGFFWEGLESALQFYGEYAYVGPSQIMGDRRLSLAVGYDLGNLWQGKVKLGVKWDHAFGDSSGSVLPAIVLQPLPHIALKVGFPVVYGTDDSIYVAGNGDPSGRRASIVVAATISVNY